MGFFSRKPSLTPDEILERMNVVDALLNDDHYQDAYDAAMALEKEAKGYGSLHLALMYHGGWGVKEDYDKALSYYQAATVIDNHYLARVWYNGGHLYIHLEDYDKAAEWLEKAEALGYDDSSLWLAFAWCNSAIKYRNYACKTLRINELTQANLVASNLAVKAQNKYMSLAQKDPDSVDSAHMVLMGRCALLLYNMACQGELSMDVTADNSLRSWVGNSFHMVAGSRNDAFHAQLLENAVCVFAVMEKAGHPIPAEYFRARCSLLDAEVHHSAEAFYRARWHMKRIGEFRAQEPETFEEIHEMFMDVDEAYAKMDHKYGNTVTSMMRKGQHPDLSPSYPAGQAPAPESCKSFMDLLERIQSAPFQPVPENKEKKGLLGFFRK